MNISKCLIFILVLMLSMTTVTSCTSLDDVEARLDSLEHEVGDLQAALSALQAAYDANKIVTGVSAITTGSGGWEITFSDNTSIILRNGTDGKDGRDGMDGRNGDMFFERIEMTDGYVTFVLVDGTSFRFLMNPDTVMPRLNAMAVTADDNPMLLVEDIDCEIVGDSLVEGWARSTILRDKVLTARFTFEGDSISLDGKTVTGNTATYDFRKPVTLTVYGGRLMKTYTVNIHSFTGLPVLWIETTNREPITSKTEYLTASYRLVEDVVTRSPGEVITGSARIRGRGNTTWGMEKKPYRLETVSRISPLGMPIDRSWVLLNNYADKTMLRTQTAFYMGSISNLEYTPRAHFVELILNGQYDGTYQFCERVKRGADRVNIGNKGFLLEIDSRAEDNAVSFTTKHQPFPIVIHEPNVDIDDEEYTEVKDFIVEAERRLYADNYTDPEEGWQHCMDIDSFADWYLINEITRNNDASFFSSCFLTWVPGEKLKMGPLWDFDISLGNIDYNDNYQTAGLWIKNNSPWFYRLFHDPVFVDRVKERFNYFYSHKEDMIREINANAQYLRYAVEENNNRWNTFYVKTWPNYNVYGSYQNEVQQMKEWLNDRLDWLNDAFKKL